MTRSGPGVWKWNGGYIRYNQIYRRVYREERLLREELVTENQAIMMYEPLLAKIDHGDVPGCE